MSNLAAVNEYNAGGANVVIQHQHTSRPSEPSGEPEP